jgi:hypothetical protein
MNRSYRDYIIAGVVLVLGLVLLFFIWRLLSGIFSRINPSNPSPTPRPTVVVVPSPTPTPVSGNRRWWSPFQLNPIDEGTGLAGGESPRPTAAPLTSIGTEFTIAADPRYRANQVTSRHYTLVSTSGDASTLAEVQIMKTDNITNQSSAEVIQSIKELCLSDNPGLDGRCVSITRKESFINAQGETGYRFYLPSLPAVSSDARHLKEFTSTGPYYLFPLAMATNDQVVAVLVSPPFQPQTTTSDPTLIENIANSLSIN